MSYTYTHVHLQPTCARAHNTHILHACEAKREATMSFVYFEIVISTCLTHKPVPYRKFFYLLRPSSLSFSTAVPFLSVPPLLRSALNAQSIFPCTFSRRPLHVRKSVRWLKFDEGNGIMVKKRKEKKTRQLKYVDIGPESPTTEFEFDPLVLFPRIEILYVIRTQGGKFVRNRIVLSTSSRV